MVADYADDKAITSTHSNFNIASHNFQNHPTLMEEFYTKLKRKIILNPYTPRLPLNSLHAPLSPFTAFKFPVSEPLNNI